MKPNRTLSAVAVGMLLSLLLSTALVRSQSCPVPAEMARIPAGVHALLFVAPGESNSIPVPSFLLDRLPVTNGDFLEFVRTNPRWRRSRVSRLFASEEYLRHWADDLELGAHADANQPVVWVSWFAAKAYAGWRGKRLPTVAEWECAASASPAQADGRNDAAFQATLRRWSSTPSPERLPSVGTGPANFFGVQDLHGLVWEWTSDFNSALVTGDARGDTGIERQLFCGAGSAGARDTANFPAFMRYGFRSSLSAAYTVHNLGFRCAKNL